MLPPKHKSVHTPKRINNKLPKQIRVKGHYQQKVQSVK